MYELNVKYNSVCSPGSIYNPVACNIFIKPYSEIKFYSNSNIKASSKPHILFHSCHLLYAIAASYHRLNYLMTF